MGPDPMLPWDPDTHTGGGCAGIIMDPMMGSWNRGDAGDGGGGRRAQRKQQCGAEISVECARVATSALSLFENASHGPCALLAVEVAGAPMDWSTQP